jgi:hypothetical protein
MRAKFSLENRTKVRALGAVIDAMWGASVGKVLESIGCGFP